MVGTLRAPPKNGRHAFYIFPIIYVFIMWYYRWNTDKNRNSVTSWPHVWTKKKCFCFTYDVFLIGNNVNCNLILIRIIHVTVCGCYDIRFRIIKISLFFICFCDAIEMLKWWTLGNVLPCMYHISNNIDRFLKNKPVLESFRHTLACTIVITEYY